MPTKVTRSAATFGTLGPRGRFSTMGAGSLPMSAGKRAAISAALAAATGAVLLGPVGAGVGALVGAVYGYASASS